jgi:hypothetical protein
MRRLWLSQVSGLSGRVRVAVRVTLSMSHAIRRISTTMAVYTSAVLVCFERKVLIAVCIWIVSSVLTRKKDM